MRAAITPIVERIALLFLTPLVVARRLRLVSHLAVSQGLSLVPGFFGLFVRRAWYSRSLMSCGPGLSVGFGTVLNNADSRVGSNCYFGAYCCVGLCDVGNDLICADNVQILSGMRHHGFARRDIPMTRQGRPQRTRIVLGNDIWIGSGAIVGADVPAHCIVAAGAVVQRPTGEDWAILGGVPAKRISMRP